MLVLLADMAGSFVIVAQDWMLYQAVQAVHSRVAVVDIHILVEPVVANTGLKVAAGHSMAAGEAVKTAVHKGVADLAEEHFAAEDNHQIVVPMEDIHSLEVPRDLFVGEVDQ